MAMKLKKPIVRMKKDKELIYEQKLTQNERSKNPIRSKCKR